MRLRRHLYCRLILFWLIILSFGEWLVFEVYVNFICPHRLDYSKRLLVLADPQLADAYSYKQTGFLLRLTEFYSDLYMRRSFSTISKRLGPQMVLFLGDLFDGGREWISEQSVKYLQEFERFKSVFHPDRGFEKVFYVAGNHDIGFFNISTEAFERYRRFFGNTSYRVEIIKHELLVLDTISLSNPQSIGYNTAMKTLEEASIHKGDRPIIFVTHVPLYRKQPCSNGHRIEAGWGYQYQNLLTAEISQLLLHRLNPVLVLSGDDHHSCAVRHRLENGTDVPEVHP